MHTPSINLRIEQVILGSHSELVGQTLKDASIRQKTGAMVLALKQNGKLITNPSPETIFQAGDELIALGTEEELEGLSTLSGGKER